MRLLILTNSRYNYNNYRYVLCQFLRKKGFEVFVTFPLNEESESDNLSNFIHIPTLSRSFSYLKEYAAYRQLKDKINKYEIDVVLSFTPKMVLLTGLLHNTRTIGTLTGMGSFYLKGILVNKILTLVYTRLYGRPFKQLVCQNSSDVQLLSKGKCTPELISGSGVLPFLEEPRKIERTFVNFLFAGRLLRDKGVIEMINAFDKVYLTRKDFKLVIAGDIDQANPSSLTKDELSKLISKDYIDFIGWSKNMSNVYDKCDIAILPSYREGLSKFLLEAMSNGIPLLVSNVPGCQDLIDGNGYLFDVHDLSDFVSKITKFLDIDFEDYRVMSARSILLINEKYSVDIVATKYVELLRKCK